MSRRIAHRPRYRSMSQFVQPSRTSRQHYLATRWSYRKQQPRYNKRPLGYRLVLQPFCHRLMGLIIQRL